MYQPPDAGRWTGRVDSVSDERAFRLHQRIRLLDLSQPLETAAERAAAFIGFACDEGVRRNQGRQGAKEAPAAVKAALARLPWHLPEGAAAYDAGDVVCVDGHLEQSQAELGIAIARLLQHNMAPIVIGGGHETAYGHYLGVREALGTDARLGILNIDAHFDLRPYDDGPTSGTMFRQILDQDDRVSYFCLGIQRLGNTAALFADAETYRCRYMLEDELTAGSIEAAYEQIEKFAADHDAVMLTICMDAISAAAAPGVSAPSPFGLAPSLARALIRRIVSHPKTISVDLCEVNPLLDEGGKTVALAAAFCMEALLHFQRLQPRR
ncbi:MULTISPECIES: formimidoylglutamase [Geobacillus]|uniref:Formimidoylglutamase n=1 Tax=Geobacillus thermocatenulatus TaxID=33938 RepID=A0A226Q1K9_9BACL|nr:MULTISPECIES: formimidoylglutamase [Geobacillus]ASS99804.1 formimidoylglutamase [Geobacillus thermocatenulatus]KLR72707.1 formimidoylglutamase [Geobacillus sp. T6]OXB86183.1 formimidoylglutamase [Geobacillus thermocatenulatus]RAN23434.1 formimidoylglutamase [Geobacillus sp. A8]